MSATAPSTALRGTATATMRAAPLPHQLDPAGVVNAAARVDPNTTTGALVIDRRAGTAVLSVNADRQFRSASLVKLLIAIDAVERGARSDDRARLAQMLSASDDDLASEYWVRGGNSAIVSRTRAAIGLTGTEPPEDPGRWGEVKVTPADIARIYSYILAMPKADRALIIDALARAPRVAADGWDQHFGIPDGIPAQWAIKQGWGNNSSAKVVHSTGLVGTDWRYIVVLLSEHPLTSSWQLSTDSVTAAARALHGTLPGL